MQFTTSLLALAATASAAVLPRADFGSWTVSISSMAGASESQRETVNAVYSTSELDAPINATCNFVSFGNGNGVGRTTCDPKTFSYEITTVGNGTVAKGDKGKQYQISLTQTVDLWNEKVTVRGTSEQFEKECDEEGESCKVEGIVVPVTSAVA